MATRCERKPAGLRTPEPASAESAMEEKTIAPDSLEMLLAFKAYLEAQCDEDKAACGLEQAIDSRLLDQVPGLGDSVGDDAEPCNAYDKLNESKDHGFDENRVGGADKLGKKGQIKNCWFWIEKI